MPFNIELTSKSVKIQVNKDAINVYFTESDETASIESKNKWQHLVWLYAHTPDCPLRGPKDIYLADGMYHSKQIHTNPTPPESTTVHSHYLFQAEITPDLFEKFLMELYKLPMQFPKEYRLDYQFFTDHKEPLDISMSFREYYAAYKGSSLEAEYEKDTKLTFKEQVEHQEDLNKEKERMQDMRAVVPALISRGIFIQGEPMELTLHTPLEKLDENSPLVCLQQ
jgi:hypothetical protein